MNSKAFAVMVPLTCVAPLGVNAQTLPIVVSGTVDLNFGSFFLAGAGGTLVMDTLDTRSTTGGVSTIAGAGLEESGQIAIIASTGFIVTISITATNYNLTNAGGDTLVVNSFNLDTNAGGRIITKSVVSNPTIVPLGATLNVPGGSPDGTYTGSYDINVIYQ